MFQIRWWRPRFRIKGNCLQDEFVLNAYTHTHTQYIYIYIHIYICIVKGNCLQDEFVLNAHIHTYTYTHMHAECDGCEPRLARPSAPKMRGEKCIEMPNMKFKFKFLLNGPVTDE